MRTAEKKLHKALMKIAHLKASKDPVRRFHRARRIARSVVGIKPLRGDLDDKRKRKSGSQSCLRRLVRGIYWSL